MHDKEPFVDQRVRQAVSKAIDRDTIVTALMGRTGSPWYQIISPQVNGYVDDLDVGFLSYDIDAARTLVQQAEADGHDTGAEFLIVTRPDLFPGSDEVVQVIAQSLQSIGLNPKILSLENTAWLTYLRQPFPTDQPGTMMMISHDNTSGDASFTFNRYITCEGYLSSTCNPRIDELASQANVSVGDERAKLFQDAATILYEEETTMFGISEQVRLLMIGENVNYTANSLTGLELLISDVSVN